MNKKNIIRLVQALGLLFFASSCATLLNSRNTSVDVYTNQPALMVINRTDTIQTYENKATVYTPRSEYPMEITAIGDSITKHVYVKSHSTIAYSLNIFAYYGLFFLVEQNSPKRYGYPRNVYLDMSTPGNEYKKSGKINKLGETHLYVGFPIINHTQANIKDEGEKMKLSGLGLSVGIDHFHARDKYLSIFGSTIPSSMRYTSANGRSGYESLTTIYLSITKNFKYSNFSWGYGLSLSEYRWYFHSSLYDGNGNPSTPDETKNHVSIGPVLQTHLQLSPHFYTGLIYRPTIFNYSIHNSIDYEHLISWEIGWKLRISKRKTRF